MPAAGHRGMARLPRKSRACPTWTPAPSTHARFSTCRRASDARWRTEKHRAQPYTLWTQGVGGSAAGHRPFGGVPPPPQPGRGDKLPPPPPGPPTQAHTHTTPPSTAGNSGKRAVQPLHRRLKAVLRATRESSAAPHTPTNASWLGCGVWGGGVPRDMDRTAPPRWRASLLLAAYGKWGPPLRNSAQCYSITARTRWSSMRRRRTSEANEGVTWRRERGPPHALICSRCSTARGYGWTGQQSGSGFSDLAPSILHYNWF
jgi:hypothetical protein